MRARFASKRLLMRPIRPGDAEALHEAYRDAGLMRWGATGAHVDMAETHAFIAPMGESADWQGWAITRQGDDRAIGTLSAGEQRKDVIEIGYLLVRRCWGQGYAREAVAGLIDLIFASGARRVFADIDPENARSIALLEALDFRREGLLRAEWETHLGVRDSLILGLLRDEWRRPVAA